MNNSNKLGNNYRCWFQMYSISMLYINFKFCGFERRSRMKKLFTARHRKIERFKDKGRKHFFFRR